MSIVNNKAKISLLVMAVVVAIALCAISLSFASGEVTAYAQEENNYAFSLTTRSFVYNANAVDLPLKVTYNGTEIDNYSISYIYNGTEVVDSPINAGSYVATITIDGTDPVVSSTVDFEITPKPLNLVVGGSTTFQYTGMGYSRNVSPLGICAGDACEIITSYVGTHHALEAGVLPSHADSYDMVFATSNPNYKVGEVDGETTLVIQKRTLYVKVNNTSVTFGETPEFTISIIGFVGDDDESVIEQMPAVYSNATAVGVHQIHATGGSAENYNFEYTSGYLTINGLSAIGSIEETSIEFDVDGVFAPSTVYNGTVIDPKSAEGKDYVKTARQFRMLNFTSKAAQIYQIDLENGAQLSEKITVKFNNVTTLNANDNYFIVVISPDGVVTKITKYDYINGSLTFTTPSLGTILIFEDSYNLTVLYITIAAVAAFVLMLFVAERIQYRNDKRHADEKARKRKEKRTNDGYIW
ncbi:MAG: hypothetical protein IJ033_01480 [Clostridia bacterium]|nr:hypothetical protein [Clostridia bacterium]